MNKYPKHAIRFLVKVARAAAEAQILKDQGGDYDIPTWLERKREAEVVAILDVVNQQYTYYRDMVQALREVVPQEIDTHRFCHACQRKVLPGRPTMPFDEDDGGGVECCITCGKELWALSDDDDNFHLAIQKILYPRGFLTREAAYGSIGAALSDGEETNAPPRSEIDPGRIQQQPAPET